MKKPKTESMQNSEFVYAKVIEVLKKNARLFGKALKNNDCEIRGLAAWIVGLCREQSASNDLIEIVCKKDCCAMQYAVHALGLIIDKRAVGPLIEALNDNEIEIQREAAWALGKYKSKKAVPFLIQAAGNNDISIAQMAIKSLGNAKSNLAFQALVKIVKSEPRPELRWVAAKSLGIMGDKRAKGCLIAALHDNDQIVRRWAKKALEQMNIQYNNVAHLIDR